MAIEQQPVVAQPQASTMSPRPSLRLFLTSPSPRFPSELIERAETAPATEGQVEEQQQGVQPKGWLSNTVMRLRGGELLLSIFVSRFGEELKDGVVHRGRTSSYRRTYSTPSLRCIASLREKLTDRSRSSSTRTGMFVPSPARSLGSR